MKTTFVISLLVGVVLLSGTSACAIMDETERDGAPQRMMDADLAPLVGGDKTYVREGARLPVPVEPSPFEQENPARPRAMNSDLETRPQPRSSSRPRAIPDEPIP